MNQYLINDLETSNYKKIITLLDYRENITNYLKNIKIPPSAKGKVLVDTALVSGLNSYRFIELEVNKDGTLNLNNYFYPEIDKKIIKKANSILNKEPVWVKNSILTKTQKESIVTMQ